MTDQEKNGTFFFRTENGIELRKDIIPNYDSVSALVDKVMPDFIGGIKPPSQEVPKYMRADDFFQNANVTTIAEDVRKQVAKENTILLNGGFGDEKPHIDKHWACDNTMKRGLYCLDCPHPTCSNAEHKMR